MIEPTGLLVDRADFATVHRDPGVDPSTRPLGDGSILLETRRFGLTSNNISYAAAGDMLGYWSFFPASEGLGRIPVWGFAEVVRSASADVAEGELLFGYLPMAPHLVIEPTDVGELALHDGTSARAALHPWYNRYYRCAADPVFDPAHDELQPVMWALFMTGWQLADQLADQVDEVWVSSASAKTAIALAWSMRDRTTATVALTSDANAPFVVGLGCYDRVVTYESLAPVPSAPRVAYVDFAGNGRVTAAVHAGLGHALVDSVLVGGTHRARTDDELVGPAPRFFFIPNVAEAHAADVGLERYHARFADAWRDFAVWAEGWVEIERGVGLDAIERAYGRVLRGEMSPQSAVVLGWD